jgi:hypothetical protein
MFDLSIDFCQCHVHENGEKRMLKLRINILAALTAVGIGLGGVSSVSAIPADGNVVGQIAPTPAIQQVAYYHRHARRHYRRSYRHARRHYYYRNHHRYYRYY